LKSSLPTKKRIFGFLNWKANLKEWRFDSFLFISPNFPIHFLTSLKSPKSNDLTEFHDKKFG
jgi:hypothetical protein